MENKNRSCLPFPSQKQAPYAGASGVPVSGLKDQAGTETGGPHRGDGSGQQIRPTTLFFTAPTPSFQPKGSSWFGVWLPGSAPFKKFLIVMVVKSIHQRPTRERLTLVYHWPFPQIPSLNVRLRNSEFPSNGLRKHPQQLERPLSLFLMQRTYPSGGSKPL